MAKQKRTSKNERQLSLANAHGCIYHLNLPDELMKRAATKCPILHSGGKSGDHRGLRYIVLNDSSLLTSKPILGDLKKEIQKQLSQMEKGGISVPTRMSNIKWVLAAPNSRNTQCGQKHRDTPYKVPGYLTVLIFSKAKEFFAPYSVEIRSVVYTILRTLAPYSVPATAN